MTDNLLMATGVLQLGALLHMTTTKPVRAKFLGNVYLALTVISLVIIGFIDA